LTQTDVTSACTAPGAEDYSYYPSAIKVQTGLGLELRAVAAFEAGGTGVLPALIDQEFKYSLLAKEFPAEDLCYGFDEQKLGRMFEITDEEPTVNVTKVQSVLDAGGTLPSGVDPGLFPSATATATAQEAERKRNEAATQVGVGALGMLVAVQVGFFLL
jgi:hypothetical protein